MARWNSGTWHARGHGYVYGILNPQRPHKILYVGSTGHQPHERLSNSISLSKNKQNAGYYTLYGRWVRWMIDNGLRPAVHVLEFVPGQPNGEKLVEREDRWIAKLNPPLNERRKTPPKQKDIQAWLPLCQRKDFGQQLRLIE